MFSKIVKFGTLVLALATAPAAFAGGMMGMGMGGMGMGGMGMGGMGMGGMGMMGMGGSAMIVSNGFSSFAVPVGTVMFSGDFDDRRVIVGTGTAGTVISSSSGFDLDDRRVIVSNGGLTTGTVLVGSDGDDFRRSAVLSNGGVITTRGFRRFDFD